MTIPVPLNVRKAPYSAALSQEPGWSTVVEALGMVFGELDILNGNSDKTLYITFKFMDGKPSSIGMHTDPPGKRMAFPSQDPINIFHVVKDSLGPTLVANPMHHAMFRYRAKEGWQAARVFDSQSDAFDKWRALRTQSKSDRLTWFKKLATKEFESIHEINLFIMIDPETTEQEVLPLLIGVDKNVVWMMTSGFSDPLSPRSGANWAELPTCDAEILYSCNRAQLGKAASSVPKLLKTLEVAAITQVAEAFYWRFIDKPKDSIKSPTVDLSKPLRLKTLAEHTGPSQALEPETPFLLTNYVKHGSIKLSDGRQILPALVTIEGALSSKLSPTLTAKVKRVTGGLGKAPKVFTGPSDLDLLTLLREEIETHGTIQSNVLRTRMQHFAALEFYFGRFLPDDLAAHIESLYLLEFGNSNFSIQKTRTKEFGDFNAGLHGGDYGSLPPLGSLKAYKGLKDLDLRMSKMGDLSWLESIGWLEKLSLGGTDVEDFSPLSFAPKLKFLDVGQTNLKDLSPIISLTELENLDLYSAEINDISPLSSLVNLKKITLSHMPISDISCLPSFQNLEEVLLAGVSIADYSCLSQLPDLKLLSIAETEIDDLSVLPTMPNLETLYIWDCINIKDLSPLERYPNLKPVNTKGTGVD